MRSLLSQVTKVEYARSKNQFWNAHFNSAHTQLSMTLGYGTKA
jgi:hypothetical protein